MEAFFGKMRPARAFMALAGIILVSGIVAVRTLHEPGEVDLFDLEAAIRRDGGLPDNGSGSILLAGLSWPWTRGELMQGKEFSFVEMNSPTSKNSGSEPEASQCLYAIVAPDKAAEFAGDQWKLMKRSPSGCVLFKNEKVSPH